MTSTSACLAFLLTLPAQAPGVADERAGLAPPRPSDERPVIGGIHPHVAVFNDEDECGIGAVVPWAGRLWVITYAPHRPRGSSDKLHEIDADRNLRIRPESVGGTPANRMIHPESQQLFIGPYVIDREGEVRVIPPDVMPGRLTGTARHLEDPENKVYVATMEEGFYEVDVHTLSVRELFPDANGAASHAGELLPGYHGKGLYSGQGRLVYANNGELSKLAQSRPDIESGVLAEWSGEGEWRIVRRNQFTEVSGPGGLSGNPDPEHDPIWSIGWDHRSLILMLRDEGRWHSFRLPKASHCYDGAHGWNTEWPRIRDIGEDDLLMTMHGMLWRFPRGFRVGNTAGLRPRSSVLKVIGDFCRWQDQVVFGCDDTARKEFLNQRRAKGDIAGPGQSQSNLWFVAPERLDQLGPVRGRGAVWLDDAVAEGEASDPFLFDGFERRSAHVANDSARELKLRLEVDRAGTGEWSRLRRITVAPGGCEFVSFAPDEAGSWIRAVSESDHERVTVLFAHADAERRGTEASPLFAGLAAADETRYSGGLVRARGDDRRTLHFAAVEVEEGQARREDYYELDAALRLRRVDDPPAHAWLKERVAVPTGVLQIDEASILYVDETGQRFRLPISDRRLCADAVVPLRVDREVCTERDLFNAGGTFYELPADNAGGFARIRPITTHDRRITDYCSYRGLLVLSGVAADATADDPRIVRSDDGKVALWLGAVDELWQLGKPRGRGGPWKEQPVVALEPSDPYLLTGFDRKTLRLSHDSPQAVRIDVQIDLGGDGRWHPHARFEVPPDQELRHRFPDDFQASWLRVVADQDCTATAWLEYD